jgi:mannose-1-phosphate guanylyltransferase
VQALILAGGEGTRLRPLTTTVPKPVVPLVDRPFIVFMLDWLRSHGVDDVIMGCGHMASGVHNVLGDGSAFDLRIRFIEEPEPLGTGGALKFAEELLDERFLMLNGDVLTDMDLSAQVGRHEAAGAAATLALVPVEDPSRYGLVRLEDDGAVREFVEKPSPDQIDTHNISAGAYVLERSVLELLEPGKPASIERDVFPRLQGNGLHGYVHEGAYWKDIGTPQSYLEASFDLVDGTVHSTLEPSASHGFQGTGVEIDPSARVGVHTVLGDGVRVGAGSTVERAVVLQGTEIGANCTLKGCIVSGGVRIGDDTHVDGLSVIGEGVTIGAGNQISNGARIFPGVTLPDGAIRF